MNFEILDGLPSSGPLPEQFSSTGLGTSREGFVVRFTPDAGQSWVGNFQPGIGGVNQAVRHPDGRRVVVVSGGQAYIVDPANRHAETLSSGSIGKLYEIAQLRLIVFDHQGILFEGLGSRGVMWRTRQISWDGFRNVLVSGTVLTGEAWNPMGDTWQAFSVDLKTGKTEGGSYRHADGMTAERLHRGEQED